MRGSILPGHEEKGPEEPAIPPDKDRNVDCAVRNEGSQDADIPLIIPNSCFEKFSNSHAKGMITFKSARNRWTLYVISLLVTRLVRDVRPAKSR